MDYLDYNPPARAIFFIDIEVLTRKKQTVEESKIQLDYQNWYENVCRL